MNNNYEFDELSEREKLLMALARILHDFITSSDMEYLEELITHSECGIAFEDIVATIIAQKINISEQDYDNFVTATKMMGMYEPLLIKLKTFVR